MSENALNLEKLALAGTFVWRRYQASGAVVVPKAKYITVGPGKEQGGCRAPSLSSASSLGT